MTGPSVSVVIPAFRASATLGRALASLRAQLRPADEVIVVDDGSPDGPDLAAVAAGSGVPIRLIHQANGGAARARNAGIEASRGDLIAFLDADDYWEPAKLARQLGVLADRPEVGLVAGRFFSEEPGCPRRGPHRPAELAGPWDRAVEGRGAEAFALATRVWTSTVLVRRGVLGDRRFTPGLEPAEDRELWVRLVTSTQTFLISEPLATHVHRPGSLSRASIDADCGSMLRVIRGNADLLGPRQVSSWEADTFRRWAAGHLHEGRPGRAVRPALDRLRRQPLSAQAWYILAKSSALAAIAPATRGAGP